MVLAIIMWETCEIVYTVASASMWGARAVGRWWFQPKQNPSNLQTDHNSQSYHDVMQHVANLEKRIQILENSVNTYSSSFEIIHVPHKDKQS